MALDRSELSSLSALVDQVLTRISAMGEAAARGKEDAIAVELFGIERELTVAARRINRLLGSGRTT